MKSSKISKNRLEFPAYLYSAQQQKDNSPFYAFFFNFVSVLTCKSAVPIEFFKVNADSYSCPRFPEPGEIVFAHHAIQKDNPNVWSVKEAPVVSLFAIDPCGYSGAADIAQHPQKYEEDIRAITPDVAQASIARFQQQIFGCQISKYEQPAHQAELPARFVFFPLQLVDDSVTQFYRFDLLESIKKAAFYAQKCKTHLVLKLHPRTKNLETKINQLQTIFFDNPYVKIIDANVQHLIQKCQSVLVFNSGVGLEALIAGKPVYAMGQNEWQQACIQVNSLDGLEAAFAFDQPGQTLYQQQVIAYLLTRYWIRYDDIEAISRKIEWCLGHFQFERAFSGQPQKMQYVLRSADICEESAKKIKRLEQQLRLLDFENETLRQQLALQPNHHSQRQFRRIFGFKNFWLLKNEGFKS